jgi:putative resolvase
MYTTTQFAKILNITPKTLRAWDKLGTLKSIKLASGHRRYTDQHLQQFKNEIATTSKRLNICYVRESTKQQLISLQNQEQKVKDFCLAKGISIDVIYSDFGSGLNFKRLKFQELLTDIVQNKVENLIIYYKDRLCRFGFELFEYFAKINNFNIIIIDNSETNKTKEQEFCDDLISIIHYFSMKLYGQRNYKKKVQKAQENLEEIKNEIIKS